MNVEIEQLSNDILSELIDFAPYYRKLGLGKDYKWLMSAYGQLFPELENMAAVAADLVDEPRPMPDVGNWEKKAHRLFAQMEKLEPQVRESGKYRAYLDFIHEFGKKFPQLTPFSVEKVKAFNREESIRKHGRARKFSRIAVDPSVTIQHCADCPDNNQQSEMAPMRTFRANKGNVVKTREQRIQEHREKTLSEDI